jgi:hypothetical protein
MHLTPEELLDLAEGTRLLASAPHLNTCQACRRQLDELRDVMGELAVDVPEPSPLFWDHLSARVHQAVAAERTSRTRRWFGVPRIAWTFSAAMSVVVVAIAVSLTWRAPIPAPTRVDSQAGSLGDAGPLAATDDPSFSLLGDLAGNLDWDSAVEAGMTGAIGTADTEVTALTDSERSELQRLLREAMATS